MDEYRGIDDSSVTPSDIVIQHCLNVFYEEGKEMPEKIKYSKVEIKSILDQNEPNNKFQRLSQELHFEDIIGISYDKSDLALALRKIFAISLLHSTNDITQTIDILACIINLKDEYEQYCEETKTAFFLVAEFFIQQTKENPKICANLPDTCNFIASSIQFIQNYDLYNDIYRGHLLRYQSNLIKILATLNCDIEVRENYIKDIIETIKNTNFEKSHTTLKKLAKHLTVFLGVKYSINTRLQILQIISKIVKEDENVSSYIFEDENLSKIAIFIKETINTTPIQQKLFVNKFPKVDNQFTPKKIEKNRKIIEKTYADELPTQISDNQTFVVVSPNLYHRHELPQNIIRILQTVQSLCDSINSESRPLAHMKLISAILSSKTFSYTTLLTIAHWTKFFVESDTEATIEIMVKSDFFTQFTEGAIRTQATDLIDFIGDLFLFLLPRSKDGSFIKVLFSTVAESVQMLLPYSQLIRRSFDCIKICPQKTILAWKEMKFDETLASALTYLRSLHIGTQDEFVGSCRKYLLEMVECSVFEKTVFSFLSISELFSAIVLQSIYEPAIQQWGLNIFKKIINNITVECALYKEVVYQLNLIFAQSSDGGFYLKLAEDVLEILSNIDNLFCIGNAFQYTHFYDWIHRFVLEHRNRKNVFNFLRIIKILSSQKSPYADYIKNSTMFSNLFDILEKDFEEKVDNEIFDFLQSIVFQTDTAPYDRILKIRNAGPLSLTFQLLENYENELIRFLKFIYECSEFSLCSALEICQSSFPSTVVSYFGRYRRMPKSDDVFNLIVSFFSSLSGHAMRTKDLICTFQNLSSLPGNFRPFFTMDFLRSFLFIFQNPYNSPSALIHFNGNGLSPLLGEEKVRMKKFTVLFDIEFLGSSGEILYLEDSSVNYVRIVMEDKAISIELLCDGKKEEGKFDYIFAQRRWDSIAITFTSSNATMYTHGKEEATLYFDDNFILKFDGFVTKSRAFSDMICNVGTFMLVRKVIGPGLIDLIARFPRNLTTMYGEEEMDSYPDVFGPLFDGFLRKNAVFIYNAAFNYKHSLINIANSEPSDFLLHTDSQIFTDALPAKSSLHLIGGPSVMLPLFAQLDQPLLPAEGEAVEYSIDLDLLPFLIQSLGFLLHDVGQREFIEQDGFQILAYLLGRCRQQHLTIKVIGCLKRMFYDISDLDLREEMLSNILMNPRLWLFIPTESQIYLLNQVEEIYRSNMEWFASAMPYSEMILLLRVCLWDSYLDDDQCLFAEPKLDPISKEIESCRPTDLSEIRQKIWSLAKGVASIKMTADDAEALCLMCFQTDDKTVAIETLKHLIELSQMDITALKNVFKKKFTFQQFVSLLEDKSEEIRLMAITIFEELSKDPQFLCGRSKKNWILLFPTIMNTENTTKATVDKAMEKIKEGEFCYLPVLFLALSYTNDSDSTEALLELANEIQEESLYSEEYLRWFEPFVEYLMGVCPNDTSIFSPAASICLNTLTSMIERDLEIIQWIAPFVTMIASKTQHDYSHILKMIYKDLIDKMLITKTADLSTAYQTFLSIFEYLYFIPDSDKYFNPISVREYTKSPAYQEIENIKRSKPPVTVQTVFGLRYNAKNNEWIDRQLANAFIAAFVKYPEFKSSKSNVEVQNPFMHPFFIYSYVLSHCMIDDPTSGGLVSHTGTLLNLFPTEASALKDFQVFALTTFLSAHIRISIQKNDFLKLSTILRDQWKQIKYQYGISKGFENVQMDSDVVHIISQRRYAVDGELEKNAQRWVRNLNKQMQTLDMENETISRKGHNELRKSAFIKVVDYSLKVRSATANSSHAFSHLWRNLSAQNGPWWQPRPMHFKISAEMQFGYRRAIMVENFNYTDHKDASLLRDLGNIENAAEKYNEHLRELKLAEFAGEPSVYSIVETGASDNMTTQIEGHVILMMDANMVTPRKLIQGRIVLTSKSIVFEGIERPKKFVKIDTEDIKEVLLRRYLLVPTAFEVFTSSGRARFFDVSSTRSRSDFLRELKKLKIGAFVQTMESEVFSMASELKRRWVEREISTFDYLMRLNFLSGRTYNDIGQYPVFPWVLSDYTSPVLDLADPSVFRDLSKPVGALDPRRLNAMIERMKESAEPYLYSSFYSSSASVIGFLIRTEPFTTMHVELQSGRFDVKERLFTSIPGAWNSVRSTPMDFRELTPEFFYMPEFLTNQNGIDIGEGAEEVELPRWASSAADFVAKHREALESDFVSAHLGEWVDLIFGAHSRLPESAKHNNIFAPYFYETALDGAKTKEEEGFVQGYAACFGQAPQQVFRRETGSQPRRPEPALRLKVAEYEVEQPILAASPGADGQIGVITQSLNLVTLKDGKRATHKRIFGCPSRLPKAVCALSDRLAVCAKPWGSAFDAAPAGAGFEFKEPRTVSVHTSRMTAAAVRGETAVTGSVDGSVAVTRGRSTAPLCVHRAPVECVAASAEADIVASCSADGEVVISKLRTGAIIKCMTLPERPTHVTVSMYGLIVICLGSSTVKVFNTNAVEMRTYEAESTVTGIEALNIDGRPILSIANAQRKVVFLKLPTMEKLAEIETKEVATVVSGSKGSLVLGSESGQITEIIMYCE